MGRSSHGAGWVASRGVGEQANRKCVGWATGSREEAAELSFLVGFGMRSGASAQLRHGHWNEARPGIQPQRLVGTQEDGAALCAFRHGTRELTYLFHFSEFGQQMLFGRCDVAGGRRDGSQAGVTACCAWVEHASVHRIGEFHLAHLFFVGNVDRDENQRPFVPLSQ